MRSKNKFKFIGTVICLFLVPFLILSRHFIYGTKALQKNDMLRYMEMRTLAGSRIVSNELLLKYNLSLLAGDKKFRAGGAAGRKAAIELKVKETPLIYSELAILTPSGTEAARASAGKALQSDFDYAKSEVFATAKKTAAAAGAVEYGEYTPPALIVVQPASSQESGKPEFYLAGRLSLAYLGELVRLMGRNSRGNFGLVDSGGQIIADSANMATMRPGIKAPPEILKMLSTAAERDTPNFTRELISSGRSYLASVSNVPSSRWWIYELMDPEDMPASGSSMRVRQIVFSGVLMIFLLGFVTYGLARFWLVRGENSDTE